MGQTFNHPFVQCATMFMGEALCLIIYGLKVLYLRSKASKGEMVPQSPGTQAAGSLQLKTNINPLLLLIPSAFDIIASTLMDISLTMVAASVYQMLRGMIIIITALMSIIFLKRKLYRHHWTSVSAIFIGVFMVGLAALIAPKDDKVKPTKAFGIILIVFAQLFTGGMFIVEEKLLGDYYLDPLKVVGWEGIWGILMYAVLLPIFSCIPCESADLCPYGHLEDVLRAFRDYNNNYVLILLTVAQCFSIAFFNWFGVTVTKNASAAQRSTIDTSRTVLIWLFFLVVPLYGEYIEKFSPLQLVGFIFLVCGTLVYNEIVIVPFLGFDRYTRGALEKREKAEKQGLLDTQKEQAAETDYTATSPHAAYDANRNKRVIHENQEKRVEKAYEQRALNKTEELSVEEHEHKHQ